VAGGEAITSRGQRNSITNSPVFNKCHGDYQDGRTPTDDEYDYQYSDDDDDWEEEE